MRLGPIVVLIPLAVVGTPVTNAQPSPSPAQARLADLAFMQGCWAGPFGDSGQGTMEEYYTTPSENLILGTTRYLRDGAAVQFEFTRIEVTDRGVVLTPYPNGKMSPDPFLLTRVALGEAVFEAPEHDFPKRIIYRTEADGTRTARIDGGPGETRFREWKLRPVPCSD